MALYSDPERRLGFPRKSLAVLYRVPFYDAVSILARQHYLKRGTYL